ncbi:FUSC family protein [Gryllotalpicola ginsengisoli]|uniref:FUSC family protein n=1 Tax=Gryllotalpicola ginsengisoli TaxID=444608 RepID=UPI0003B682CF|nr:FUSC family protein [Gryllotalpicola ginsengisoli]
MLEDLWRNALTRLRRGARFGVASIAAALLSFFTIAYLARHEAHLVQLCIAGFLIALSLVRADESRADRIETVPAWVTWAARFALIPVVALLGSLLVRVSSASPALALALISIPLVAAVWVRRFGDTWTRVGTLWSFPFVAALVTPVAAAGQGAGDVWWGALAALIAVAWASLIGWLARGATPASVLAPAPAPAAPAPAPSPGARRLAASDRMALHLAVALAAAILVGWWLLPDHLVWFVLTAYVVTSGNRGRADVVYKGVLRVVGAAIGTVVATALGLLFDPGDSDALAVMFLLLGIGAILRALSYAWWAAAMTGALALLYGYLGQGAGFLGERLVAILVGGAIAIAASAFIAPVRSIDVLRRRTADLLAVAREVLTADRKAPGYAELPHRVRDAAARIEQLAPPLHALRAVTLGRVAPARAAADLLDAALALREPLLEFAAAPSRERGAALRQQVGAVRESLLAWRRE